MKNFSSHAEAMFRFNRSVLAIALVCLATSGAAFAAKDPTDVTAVVAAAVKDNGLSIVAGNKMFGDTVPGVPKKLTVE